MARTPPLFPFACLAAAALSACHSSQGSLPEPPGIARSASLQAVSSCEELRQIIADTAVTDMRMTLASEKEGGWAWGGGRILAAGPAASGGDAAQVPTSSGPVATTGTNDQVQGVDESDFMKSDGTRILVLSGRTLFLSKSWPPQDLALASSVQIEGWSTELFLDEKARAVVLSMVPDLWQVGPVPMMGGGGMGVAIACRVDTGCFWGPGTTKVTVLDVSDLLHPKVLDEQYLPGRVQGARRVGASVRIVLTDPVRWPEGVAFWPDTQGDWWSSPDKLAAALDALADANEKVIRATPLSQWLPPDKRKLADGTVVDVAYRCQDFYAPTAPVRLGLATVATLDLDAGGAATRASIVGEASRIYASQQSLYLAEQHWWWWPRPGQKDYTYVHQFDLSDPARAQYLASGGVDGHPVDQFAMDEFDGRFRIATTTATRVPENDNRWGRLELSNRLTVLQRDGARLAAVGDSGPFEDGEAIRSARFVGDRAYVVTFKNIDPLISFDLSDPAHPRVAGKLVVPGFSTYLHPIDPDHLLALGIDLPEPDASGRVDFSQRRMQLALYDVSKLDAPQRLFVQLVGTASGWSDAAYEHRAFNWFGPRKLLAIPFSDWAPSSTDPWGRFVSDLRLFRVDAAAGITPIGALSMTDLFQKSATPQWSDWYSAWVRRSVMSTDDAGVDYVYAISDAGLRVANVTALDKPLASVAFPRQAVTP